MLTKRMIANVKVKHGCYRFSADGLQRDVPMSDEECLRNLCGGGVLLGADFILLTPLSYPRPEGFHIDDAVCKP